MPRHILGSMNLRNTFRMTSSGTPWIKLPLDPRRAVFVSVVPYHLYTNTVPQLTYHPGLKLTNHLSYIKVMEYIPQIMHTRFVWFWLHIRIHVLIHFDGLVQVYNISSALAMEILQSCTDLSISELLHWHYSRFPKCQCSKIALI